MGGPNRYSPEVRLVLEHEREHDPQWATIRSITAKIGTVWRPRDAPSGAAWVGGSRRRFARTWCSMRWSRHAPTDRWARRRTWCTTVTVEYFSIRYTQRPADAGIEPSVGSRGDSYDGEPDRAVAGSLTPVTTDLVSWRYSVNWVWRHSPGWCLAGWTVTEIGAWPRALSQACPLARSDGVVSLEWGPTTCRSGSPEANQPPR